MAMHPSESDLLFALLGTELSSVCVCVGLVGLALHRWRLPHTWLFTVTMLSLAWTTAMAPLQGLLGHAHPFVYALSTLLSGYAGPSLMLFSSRAVEPRRPLSLGWLALGLPGTAFAVLVLSDPSMLDFVARFRAPDGPRTHPILTPLYLAHTTGSLGCVLVSAVLVARGVRRAAPSPHRRALSWLLASHVIGVCAVLVYGLLPGLLRWTWLIPLGPVVCAVPTMALLYRSLSALAEAAAAGPRAAAATRQLSSVALSLRGLSEDVAGALARIAESADALGATSLSPEERRALAARVRSGAHDAERIVERMMRFAGGARAQEQDTRVLSRIRAVAYAHRTEPGLDVRVEAGDAAAEARVSVDPAAFDDALAALLSNARAAARPEREARVTVRVAVQRPTTVDPHALGAELDGGDAVRIDVEDDGTGMTADVLERALVPFFTTRPEAGGLGLVDVVSVVRAASGALLLRSTPGLGTSVTLWLPLAAASPSDASLSPEDRSPLAPVVLVTADAKLAELLTLLLDARDVASTTLVPDAAGPRLHHAPGVRTVLFDARDMHPDIDTSARRILSARADVDVVLLGADASLARGLRMLAEARVHVLRRTTSASTLTAALARGSA